tara:strand:- start:75947 stop:76798 length:852 start_codon:yes stop_codon:yes gene_type:complete
MAKRILIFESLLGFVNQISSQQFHYYSIYNFQEIISFLLSEDIDLLILKGNRSQEYYPKILELAKAKGAMSFPIALCVNSEEFEFQHEGQSNSKNLVFKAPQSDPEWDNVCRILIDNFKIEMETKVKYAEELSFLQKKNARLERELSMKYFINAEKIIDIQRVLNQTKEEEGLDEKTIESQLFKIRVLLSRLLRLEKTWRKFILHFELVCPSFTKSLIKKHPNLSQNDLRLCVHLKIGTSNKEISIISNVNEGSVRKTLNRMKKKMKLGREDDLRLYIHSIDG